MLNTVFSLDFLNRHEHVIMAGPVGALTPPEQK